MVKIEDTAVLLKRPGGGIGTGHIVGDGLILTALHNVFSDRSPDKVIPSNAPCPDARITGDFQIALTNTGNADLGAFSHVNLSVLNTHPLAKFYKTSLLWPVAGEAMPGTDLAVLKLSEAGLAASQFAKTPPTFTVQSVADREATLQTGGFPKFQAAHIGRNKTIYRLPFWTNGKSKSAAASVGSFRATTQLDITDPIRDNLTEDEWKGMSGAAVWEEVSPGRYVLSGVLNEAGSGRVLYFYDMGLMANVPGFWWALGRQLDTAVTKQGDAPRPATASTLKSQLVRFDRTRAAPALETWLSEAAGSAQIPLVIPFTGHTVDELGYFVDTAMDTLEEGGLLPFGHAANRIGLGITPNIESAAAGKAELLKSWGDKLDVDGFGQVPSAAALADALADPVKQRVVVLEHALSAFTEFCEAAIDGVLEVLSTYAARPSDQAVEGMTPPVLILPVTLGRKRGEFTDAFLPADNDFQGKSAALTAALDRLQTTHGRLRWCRTIPGLHRDRPVTAHVRSWVNDLRENDFVISHDHADHLYETCDDFDAFPFRFAKRLVDGLSR